METYLIKKKRHCPTRWNTKVSMSPHARLPTRSRFPSIHTRISLSTSPTHPRTSPYTLAIPEHTHRRVALKLPQHTHASPQSFIDTPGGGLDGRTRRSRPRARPCTRPASVSRITTASLGTPLAVPTQCSHAAGFDRGCDQKQGLYHSTSRSRVF